MLWCWTSGGWHLAGGAVFSAVRRQRRRSLSPVAAPAAPPVLSLTSGARGSAPPKAWAIQEPNLERIGWAPLDWEAEADAI